jgi:hypothetical protein
MPSGEFVLVYESGSRRAGARVRPGFAPEGDAGLYVQFFGKGKEIQELSIGKSTYAASGV